MLYEELRSNAAALQQASRSLAAAELPYPLFDTTTVDVAFQSGLFESLPPETANALLHVRNRIETANDLHAMVFDFGQGPTAVLAAISAYPMTDPEIKADYDHSLEHRDALTGRLLERVQDLAPHLYKAIDVIEATLISRRQHLPRNESSSATRRARKLRNTVCGM